ncbi:MAG: phenyltransferase domain-containing protein [Deltaproteobacteria bacterium]|nr:MAG: phenyltransferase domain-containing protein [Deltaproteobacteria bacterium]RLB75448.1 MAG: phenyltransferase domain-containing protein [Deltaproteobacteria bacterium]
MSVLKVSRPRSVLVKELLTAADYIAGVQRKDGEIPWSRWGKTDIWDHVESAMGLTVGGYTEEAKKAYLWCVEKQLPDGSWCSSLWRGKPRRGWYKDANATAYIATGLLHYFMATGDVAFVERIWPTVVRAVDFVVGLQGPEGQIYWARNVDGSVDKKALLTGCCSIYLSLGCAIRLGELMGEHRMNWRDLRCRLKDAISSREDLFDPSTRRYAMDWYYPVLCAVLRGEAGRQRLEKGWDTFIIEGTGVRCVCDRPWITLAETSELVIALAAGGLRDLAEEVFGWIGNMRYKNGAYWTGFTLPDCRIFTKEKTTWTAASTLLAADMLYHITPASEIFSHSFWDQE